ncbi:MAG: polyketide cyclase [Candidatus Dormibacteria bacterium]
MAADYHFRTRWRVPGTREEVADVLRDATDLVRWWPSVYLDVRLVEPGDEDGVGRVVELWTKGWLPYTLQWRFTTTRNSGADGLSLRAEGDFVGNGTWIFKQDGPYVKAFYDWRIAAEKPLLKRLTWMLRPAFSGNHRWAMRQGERSLEIELRRRRGEPVGRPPGPTFARLLRRSKQGPAPAPTGRGPAGRGPGRAAEARTP